MNLHRKTVFNLEAINIPITVKGYVSFLLLSVIILSGNGEYRVYKLVGVSMIDVTEK